MKKILYLPLLVMLAIFASCSSDDKTNMPEFDSREFTGKLLFNDAPVASDIKCGLNVIDETAAITLYGVQFAPTMPAMDITMPLLSCKKSAGGYVISGRNVVPMVGTEPYEALLISSVEASLSGDKFVVSAVTPMGTIGFSNALVEPVKPSAPGADYSGTLSVDDFVNENVQVSIARDVLDGTLDIFIDNAKFAPSMPVQIDITLKGIPYTEEDGRVEFEAADILPFINSEAEPTEAYKFAAVSGVIESGTINFTAQMATDLAAYVAGKVFVYEGVEVAE